MTQPSSATMNEKEYFEMILAAGRQCGLSEENLLEFAMSKSAARAKEIAEREEKLRKEEMEREEKLRKEKMEREQAQRTHELELARIQAQTPSSASASGNGGPPRERAPPMQKYEEDKQPLDTYLRSFESLVAANEGTEAEKVHWLLASMPPRLIALVNELDSVQLKDYDKVKATLLASQNFSPAECRARFVAAFPLKEENCSAFGCRKVRLFQEWLRVAKCPMDKLFPFLMFDSIANDLPADALAYVRTQLKDDINLERSLAAVDEFLQHNQPGVRLCDVMRARRADHKARPQNVVSPAASSNSPQKGDGKRGKHKSHPRNNKHPTSPQSSKPPQRNPSSPKRDTAGKPKPFHFRGKGNSQASSSQGAHQNSRNHRAHSHHSGPHIGTRSANAVDARPERASDNYVEDLQYEAATVEFTESDDPQLVPKCPGEVNGVSTEIALDTGASGIFVDKKFVREGDYTGQVVRLRVADGEPQLRRCCLIDLNCKYYKGKAPTVAR